MKRALAALFVYFELPVEESDSWFDKLAKQVWTPKAPKGSKQP